MSWKLVLKANKTIKTEDVEHCLGRMPGCFTADRRVHPWGWACCFNVMFPKDNTIEISGLDPEPHRITTFVTYFEEHMEMLDYTFIDTGAYLKQLRTYLENKALEATV